MSVFVLNHLIRASRGKVAMKRNCRRVLLLFAVPLTLAVTEPMHAEVPTKAPFEIGTAKADVTPDHPMREWGGGHNQKVTSCYHPIHVRVMTLGSDQDAVVLVNGEFLYWPDDVIETVRLAIADRYGIAAPQVLINSTHTHNGPQFNTHDAYKQHLVATVVRMVGASLDDARPGRFLFARTKARIGANRRRLDENGFVRWGINPYGTIDGNLPGDRKSVLAGRQRSAVAPPPNLIEPPGSSPPQSVTAISEAGSHVWMGSDERSSMADQYRVRFGDYLVAMNTTVEGTYREQSFTIPVDSNATEALDLVSGQMINLSKPVELGPRTTIVLYLGEND